MTTCFAPISECFASTKGELVPLAPVCLSVRNLPASTGVARLDGTPRVRAGERPSPLNATGALADAHNRGTGAGFTCDGLISVDGPETPVAASMLSPLGIGAATPKRSRAVRQN